MHAADIARELGIPRTLIPASPGVLSAVGLSTTDLQFDQINTKFTMLGDLSQEELQADYDALVDDVRARLRRDGVAAEDIDLELIADCRYEGQGYELNVPVSEDGMVHSVEEIDDRFDRIHESEFGHSFPENPIEVVNERVTAYGRLPSSELVSIPPATEPAEEKVMYREEAYFNVDGETRAYETPFIQRADMRAGHEFAGPAIVAEKDATIVIPPDFDASVLSHGDIELTH
jgi:N-methylhydantoinase A